MRIIEIAVYQRLALLTEKTPVFINPEMYGGDREQAHRVSRLLHGMIGVVTEIGEALDVLKKHLIYGKPIDWVNLMEEAGDKQWYIALIASAVGFDPEEILGKNIEKLKARFGDKFSAEAALNRDLDKERAVLEGLSPEESLVAVLHGALARASQYLDALGTQVSSADIELVKGALAQKLTRRHFEAAMALMEDGTAMGLENVYGQLLRILAKHVGERGKSEGAVDVLERIVDDRDAAKKILVEGLKYYEHDSGIPKHVLREALEKLGVKREEQP